MGTLLIQIEKDQCLIMGKTSTKVTAKLEEKPRARLVAASEPARGGSSSSRVSARAPSAAWRAPAGRPGHRNKSASRMPFAHAVGASKGTRSAAAVRLSPAA